MLQLNCRLIGHIRAHALGKGTGIQRFHRQVEQQISVVNLLLSRQPSITICPRGLPESVGPLPHLGHHGVKIQEGGARAISHHLVQHHIAPIIGIPLELGIKGLLLDRNQLIPRRHRSRRRTRSLRLPQNRRQAQQTRQADHQQKTPWP